MKGNYRVSVGVSDILESAQKNAMKNKCIEIGTLNVIEAIYGKESQGNLPQFTGVSRKDFHNYFMAQLGTTIAVASEKTDLKIMNDFSDELAKLFDYMGRITNEINSVITVPLMVRTLMSLSETVQEAFKELGVDVCSMNMLYPIEFEYPILLQFGTNMNMQAKLGVYDKVTGRDAELNKVIETLGRRVKSNPLIIGDAGVGKTSIVEALADRINHNEVPFYLKDRFIISIDISALVSGTKYRGDFEQRMNSLLNVVKNVPQVILFFDEFHTLTGSGGREDNENTAANILKPLLARPSHKGGITMSVIGATTTKEYNKFIEQDEAFSRRFEAIMVGEPNDDDAFKMVKASIESYEKFHSLSASDEVIRYTVALTSRYMTNANQPDKTLTVLDQTFARVKNAENIDDARQISKADVRETISNITGVDIEEMTTDTLTKLKGLNDRLKHHLIGQDNAVDMVASAIKRSKVGFSDHNKPIGSFLFVGPTGVGKTELAKRLSNEFSGRRNNLVRFDMSEFMEKHSVSRMIGSPPGYVGHEDGGQLTDVVKRNPYSVILFDEIEKAHPDVFNIMLQILDDGRLTDSHGKVVDFCNTIILMTSNAGYGLSEKSKSLGFGASDEREKVNEDEVMKALKNTFKPEFLNRIDKVVVFNELTKNDIKGITMIALDELANRMAEMGVNVKFSDGLVEYIGKKGFDAEYGARNVKRFIQNNLETPLADKFIDGEFSANDTITVDISEDVLVVNKEIKKSTRRRANKASSLVDGDKQVEDSLNIKPKTRVKSKEKGGVVVQ